MKILVINCGSSSIKFQFLNLENEDVLASGIVEKIGEDIGNFKYEYSDKKIKRELVIKDHVYGVKLVLDHLMDQNHGVIKDDSEIDAVGHRLVHGGEDYASAVKIDEKVIEVMTKNIELAPLHNPANISGIEAITKVLPNIPQGGLFDTAFHQTMPAEAYLYGLSKKFYRENHIRRYGFHGTSHKFVAERAAEFMNKDIKDLKIITCHLGNGASIAAVKGGISIDTSMGFTPLEGLMMGTRCGDIDPQIPIFMMQNLGMSVDEVNTELNKHSGMLGLSELSNDMRTIEDELEKGENQDVIDAFNTYAYKIKKYIGSYAAAMNGVDAIVFTGGIGENMPVLREKVCSELQFLGLEIDKKVNHQWTGKPIEFNTADSKVKALKINTNEELMIALETRKALEK